MDWAAGGARLRLAYPKICGLGSGGSSPAARVSQVLRTRGLVEGAARVSKGSGMTGRCAPVTHTHTHTHHPSGTSLRSLGHHIHNIWRAVWDTRASNPPMCSDRTSWHLSTRQAVPSSPCGGCKLLRPLCSSPPLLLQGPPAATTPSTIPHPRSISPAARRQHQRR